MQSKIIEFLASFEDREYHEINSFVKENFSNLSVGDVKQMLQRLSDKNRIEFNPNKSFNRWGLHTKIPEINTEQNTIADYDNWSVMARLTWEELEKIEEDKINDSKNKLVTNIQNIGINSGVAVHGSDFSEATFLPITNPIITPNVSESKTAGKISLWIKVKKEIWIIIAGVIIMVIGTYIVWKLGWI